MKHVHLFLFLLLANWAYAHIPGQVLDEKGEPLVGANVYWANTSVGTATDADGMFEIEPIRQTKQLVTSFLGYRNDTTVVKDKSMLVIVLVPDNANLDEVTITERKLSVVRDRMSALDVTTLTGQELCKAACCNLSESFETSASVDVAYSDAATGAKQIKMLGLSGMYVQLLSENCPSIRGLAQNFGMEYVPGPWMQSIQVSKGTSSVINGYEAITGQINVEYLKPQLQDPVAVNAMINKDLQAEVNLTGGWDIPIPHDPLFGSLSTGVLAHYQEGAWPMDENKDGFLDMPTNRNLNLLNRWYYKNDAYTFQFLIRGLHDERHGGQRANQHTKKGHYTLPADPYRIDLTTDRMEGMMKNGFILNEETGMSIGLITAAGYHRQRNTYGQRLWNASQWNGYLNAIFQNTWEGGEILGGGVDNDHKLSAGVSVNYDQYTEMLQVGERLNLDRQEVTPGAFAEYTYSIADKFSMIAGIRGDWSSRYGWFCTPRFNVRYAPFAWWTLRGSVGLGYRSPNMVADHANFLPSSRQLLVDGMAATGKPLDQERSLNTGVSMMWDIPIGSRNLQVTAEYYYTRFFNEVVADMDGSTNAVNFYNLSSVDGGQSFSHNAQIEATMEILRGWTLTAAFRYTDVRQTTRNAATGEFALREKALTNRFKGVITTSYKTPLGKWQFDFTAQFNGPGRVPDGLKNYYVEEVKSRQYYERGGSLYHKWYPQLMAQVTKNFKYNISVYLGAENMTNFTQDSPVKGSKDEQGIILPYAEGFDASNVWGPTTGWKIYLGMRWNLDKE